MTRAQPRQGHWRLDYGWSKRGGRWNVSTDVMLIGDTRGDACCAHALQGWVARQDQGRATVDGQARAVFYAGGVCGYLDSTTDSTRLCLHSRGEDAFDSLSHFSREIAAFVRSRRCEAPLVWVEARHDRADHRLTSP